MSHLHWIARLALAVPLVLVACDVATVSPAARPVATPIPAPDDCDGPHAAPELEQRLPDQIGGDDLCRRSVGHTNSMDELEEQLALGALYAGIAIGAVPGATLDDFTWTLATTEDASVLSATRIGGATPVRLLDVLRAFQSFGSVERTLTVSGIEVIETRIPDVPDATTYGWVIGDVLYQADAGDLASLEELVEASGATIDP